MSDYFPVVIIGAGQAGLSTSYFLKQQGIEHVILEKDQIASTWVKKRWDSFTLVTPNWMNTLAGAAAVSDDPSIFLTKQQVFEYIRGYAKSFDAPVQIGVEVFSIDSYGRKFELRTSKGNIITDQVVVATSIFNKPKIPLLSADIPEYIYQMHSEQYKRPELLPQGSILVVGAGQSGGQIAEELLEAGKSVFLSTSKVGRLPRLYRGKDITEWMFLLGMLDASVTPLSQTEGKFIASPCMSGTKGGHPINLRELHQKGLTLLGGIQACESSLLILNDNLFDNLKYADEYFFPLQQRIDQYIIENQYNFPVHKKGKNFHSEPDAVSILSLEESNISTIIWATGYSFDFSWVHLNAFDQYGYPDIDTGVSKIPGLYFVGMHGNYKNKSGFIFGISEVSSKIAEIVKIYKGEQ